MNYYEIETSVLGAKNGSKEDLLKILKQYKPFIFKTARRYNIKNHDINDLEQIGYMAIIKALAKYRTGSCTFSSYAYECIKNTFKNTARQNSKQEVELSLNWALDPSGKTSEFIDCIASLENLEENILRSEEASEMKKAISKLPRQEMELILAVYYKDVPLKDYAAKEGISYQKASRKKDFVLYKLGNQLKQ